MVLQRVSLCLGPLSWCILSLWFLGKKRVSDLQGQRGSTSQVPCWDSPEPVLPNSLWVGEPSITEAAYFLSSMGLVALVSTHIWFQIDIFKKDFCLIQSGNMPTWATFSCSNGYLLCWACSCWVSIQVPSVITFSVVVKQFAFLFQVIPCHLCLAYTCTQLERSAKMGLYLFLCSRYLIISLYVFLLCQALSVYASKAHFAGCLQWLITALNLEGTYSIHQVKELLYRICCKYIFIQCVREFYAI